MKPLSIKLLSECRGTSVIEFALAAPILALLAAGITDFGRGLSASFNLNQSVQRTLEKAAVSNKRTDFAYLRAEAAAGAGVPESNVTINAWLECSGTRMPNFTDSCSAGQQVARYVEVTAKANFVPSFPYSYTLMGISKSGDGAMPLQSKAAIRVQ